jgi:hypothetical protein
MDIQQRIIIIRPMLGWIFQFAPRPTKIVLLAQGLEILKGLNLNIREGLKIRR